MDRKLVRLEPSELNAIAVIGDDGALTVSTDALIKVISKALGLVGVRVAVSDADYLGHEDGVVESATRSLSGVWWLSHGDDTALVGGFVMDGLALTITTEGEGESPVAEDIEIINRATRAIASQYSDVEVVEPGLFKVAGLPEAKSARVVVTRDYRVRRPLDVLDVDEFHDFERAMISLVVVQIIGDGKALVVKHRI